MKKLQITSTAKRQIKFDYWYENLRLEAHSSSSEKTFCVCNSFSNKGLRLTRILFHQITVTMGEALIEGSNWRLVEVGRIVVVADGHPCQGRLAAIVEIIDHKRVCDG